jgi:hypothetical protein
MGLISLTFSGLLVGVIAGVLLSFYFSIAPRIRDIKRPEINLNPLPRRERKPKIKFEDLITLEDMEAYVAANKKQKPYTYKSCLEELRK